MVRTTNPAGHRAAVLAGWFAIAISVLVLLVFAAVRMGDMAAGSPTPDAYAVRYVSFPWSALAHMLPGLLFITLAPLQFVSRIRRRRLNLHRWLGRLLVAAAAISGIFALVIAFRLPAFGGINTQAATLFFGIIFLYSLAKAVVHIRNRRVAAHREWMIRVFALAMGVATIRLVIAMFLTVSAYTFEEVFGTAFWLGLGTNLLVAEVWIQATRGAVPR